MRLIERNSNPAKHGPRRRVHRCIVSVRWSLLPVVEITLQPMTPSHDELGALLRQGQTVFV